MGFLDKAVRKLFIYRRRQRIKRAAYALSDLMYHHDVKGDLAALRSATTVGLFDRLHEMDEAPGCCHTFPTKCSIPSREK